MDLNRKNRFIFGVISLSGVKKSIIALSPCLAGRLPNQRRSYQLADVKLQTIYSNSNHACHVVKKIDFRIRRGMVPLVENRKLGIAL